jgi:hypothetical protein
LDGLVIDPANDNPLQVEMLAEKAAAYFARVRKMQAALAALARFDENARAGKLSPAEAKELRANLLAEAREQVWFFVIQREAMKLPHYDALFSDFDIPDEVRLGMGPKIAVP